MATNEAIAAFRREQALKNEAATRGLPVSDAPPDSQVVAAPDVSVETATDPAIDAFRQEQEDIKKLRPPEVEPQFDITNPSVEGAIADAGTLAGNIMPDAREVGGVLQDLATPSGVASLGGGIAESALGAGEILGAHPQTGNAAVDFISNLTTPIPARLINFASSALSDEPAPLSSRAELTKTMLNESTRFLRHPQKSLINHPVQTAMDIAGILSAGALGVARTTLMSTRMTNTAAKLGTLMEYADPVNVVFKLGGKVVSGGAFRALLSRTSGTGGESLRLARDAGRAGADKAEDFVKAMVGETTLQAVSEKVQKGFKLLRSERSRGFAESLQSAHLKPGQQLDISGLRLKILEDLKKRHGVNVDFDSITENAGGTELGFNITIENTPAGVRLKSPAASREMDQVKALVHQLFLMGNDPTDWRRLHEVRKSVSDLETFGGDPLGRTFLDDTLDGARKDIGKELDKVEGFTAASNEYARASRDLEKIAKALSIKDGIISGVNLTKLGNLLNTRTSGNLSLRRDAVHLLNESLSEVTGKPSNIMEELAGLRLAGDETLGIARQGGLQNAVAGGAGLLTGSTVGAVTGDVGTAIGFAAGSSLGALLAQCTIGSPRAVGQLFFNLGMAQRPVVGLIKFLEDVKKKVPGNRLRQGLTVGAAWELIRQRPENRAKAQNLMRSLGLPQPGDIQPQQ